MKGNIYSRLFIPKPCHEDWNKMTPDEKGAFCKSCNKSVYDFTTRNEEQVESILNAAKGQEVCGRFNSSQLAPLPELEIPVHLLPRNVSPYRKFVLAVFIVFGTALFGCVNSYGQKMGKVKLVDKPVSANVEQEITMKGEVIMSGSEKVHEAQEKLPAIMKEPEIMGDTIFLPPTISEPELHMLGGVKISNFIDEGPVNDQEVVEVITEVKAIDEPAPVDPVTITCGLSMLTEEMIITGNVSVVVTRDVPVTGELPVSYADVVEQPLTVEQVEQIEVITGGIPGTYGDVSSHHIGVTQEQENEETVPDVISIEQHDSDSNNSAITIGDGVKPSIECYPNPSNGPVNIRYEIKKRCDVKLEVFDKSGRKMRTLLDKQGYYNGIYTTAFDLSDLDAGTYICVLQAGNQVSSAKIVITK